MISKEIRRTKSGGGFERMKIRKFKNEDAKEVCNIIKRNDKEISSKDYPKLIIDSWIKNLTLDYIIKKSEKRICFVAILDNKVIGYVSLDNNEIKKLFVNPDYHKLGIGRKLMLKIENISKKNNLNKLFLKSSIYAENFYKKVGFEKLMEINLK
jgi:N-acetylglutamate synthase-like GNAT family acetyltransferase